MRTEILKFQLIIQIISDRRRKKLASCKTDKISWFNPIANVRKLFAMSIKQTLQVCLSLVLFIFSLGLQRTNAQTNGPEAAINFKSVLLESYVVTEAVFGKEIFLSGVPEQARNEVFFLKLDGENYFLGRLSDAKDTNYTALGGEFEDTLWEASPNYVTFYSRKSNSGTNNTIPVLATESVMKMTANLFINFGITEMLRKTATVVSGQNRIVARKGDGGTLIIDFDGDMDFPSKAIIKNEHGEATSYIKYTYNPTFMMGKIPCEFTRYYSGAPTEDVGKIFTVRVSKFAISKTSLPPDALDPNLVFKLKRFAFYSNDVLYWKGAGEKSAPQRVLTAEEAAKQLPTYVREPGRRKIARAFLLAVVGFSIVGAMMLIKKRNTKT